MKLQCDLFDFAYVPGWYWQLDCLVNSLYILNISPLSDVGLVKIISHSVDCYFIRLMVLLPYRSSLS